MKRRLAFIAFIVVVCIAFTWHWTGIYNNNRLSLVTAQQLAGMLMNYRHKHGQYPILNGLSSWRVVVLSDYDEILRQEYHFDRPWNDPINVRIANYTPLRFREYMENRRTENRCRWVAVKGPGGAWECRDTDPNVLSKTILFVEVQYSTHTWTEPIDLTIEEIVSAMTAAEGAEFQVLRNAVFVDGTFTPHFGVGEFIDRQLRQ